MILPTRALRRTVVPMAGILLLGGLLAWLLGELPAIVPFQPLHVVTDPLAELTRQLALALAVVYGVRVGR